MKKAFLLILILGFTSPVFSQSKIEDMKEDVEEDKGSSSSSSSSHSSSGSSNSGSYYASDYNAGYYFGQFVFGYSAQLLFGFGNENLMKSPKNGGKGFNSYPYADGEKGKYSPESLKGMAGELSVHYFTENYDISGLYLKTRLAPANFLDVQFDMMSMVETVSEFEKYRLTNNSLILNYNRVQGGRCNIWWGAGAYFWNSLSDMGALFQMGTDIWVIKPVSLEANVQFTGVNKTPITIFHAKLALHQNRFAAYAGYQSFRVGDTGIRSWMAGGSVYF